MPYRVLVLPPVVRELQKMPANDADRVARRIDALATQPRPSGVRKLRGSEDRYRVRCGRCRVLYRIDDDAKRVFVYAVGDRKDVYR